MSSLVDQRPVSSSLFAQPARPRLRVMIVPGLHGSGPAHWQSWMVQQLPGAVRVEAENWSDPRIGPRAQAVADLMTTDPAADWLIVAHSLGCLAVAHLGRQLRQTGGACALRGALLVAPAHPERFGENLSVQERLPFLAETVISRNDPWLSLEAAFALGEQWGSRLVDAGPVGHLNAEAGFGPWPYGLRLMHKMQRELLAAHWADSTDLASASQRSAA